MGHLLYKMGLFVVISYLVSELRINSTMPHSMG